MSARKPMPPDFPEHATESFRALIVRYHVSWDTVKKWRDQLGVKVPVGRRPDDPTLKAKRHFADKKQVAAICLNCTAPRCNGECERIREVAD